MNIKMILDKLRLQTDDAAAKFIWLGTNGLEEETLTGVEIYRRAGAVAHMLVAAKLKPGDRAMIAYPPGLDFLAALIGCARAGVICCSVYPPDPAKLKKSFAHFCTFAKDAGTDYVLTTSTMKKIMQGAALLHGPRVGLKYIVTDAAAKGVNTPFQDFPATDKDIMFIQYSSGSTGTPKGVMISHGALVRNITRTAGAISYVPNDRACCWLPQYHDYGLVTNYLAILHLGRQTLVCMSPFTFLRDPLIWPRTIMKYNCTQTSGPNFAYSLVHRRWKESGEPTLSLSSIVNATMGGEPIQPSTIEKMVDMGFTLTSIRPGYGIAENVMFVTSDGIGQPPRVHNGRVACGRVNYGSTAIHVDQDGEIFIQGDDLASGYWNRPELTQATFHNRLAGIDGEWLRTGDLGFIQDNLLYITGRTKELIKVRGKNYFPTDIEACVEKAFSTWLRPGCSAAFQHTDASIGYVAEVRDEKSMPDTGKITQHILSEHGIQCTYIKLGPKGSLPKTTSGKIKRVQVQADAQSATTSTSSSGLDTSSFIQALSGTENSTLDLDKSLAENGADSMTQVEIENKLGSSRVLTEHHRTILRSGRSLRDIAQELADSPERPRNITEAPFIESTMTKSSCFIPDKMRSLLFCVINLINLAIPLSIAGALYELYVPWGAILAWAGLYTVIVIICVKCASFGGINTFEIIANSPQYIRWYFCRNMLAIWNTFVGNWIAGSIPYSLFLRMLGARVHPLAIVETLFEYVDARLVVSEGARVSGFCDVAAHRGGPNVLRFAEVYIGIKSVVRANARMWPGSSLGDGSILDFWSRLYFNEQVNSNFLITGSSPAHTETLQEIPVHTHIGWINITRLAIVPLYIIGAFELAALITNLFIDHVFFSFVAKFLIFYAILVITTPVIKRILIDNFNILSYFVDQLGKIVQNAMERIFYPTGGPLWNIYLRLYGADVAYDTIIGVFPGSASNSGLVIIKNQSFINGGVQFKFNDKPTIIDNSECGIGAVVSAEGLKDVQALRNGIIISRVVKNNNNQGSRSLVRTLFISWFSTTIIICSIYPTFLLCEYYRVAINSKFGAVLAIFIPAILLQTVLVFPLLSRIMMKIFEFLNIPYSEYFTSFFFIRANGAQLFFAGSPLYNLSLNLTGATVSIDSRFFGNIWDNQKVRINDGCVIDYCSNIFAHLYSQREFRTYKTNVPTMFLAEGPACYVNVYESRPICRF